MRTSASVTVFGVKAAKLVLSGVGDARCVGDHEADLLCQPPPYDRVVLVKAEGAALACQEVLFDQSRKQSVHLLRRGFALPLIGKGLP